MAVVGVLIGVVALVVAIGFVVGSAVYLIKRPKSSSNHIPLAYSHYAYGVSV